MYKERRKSNFADLLKTYRAFQEKGVEDPFLSTLLLYDIVSNGALRRMDLTFLERSDIELTQLAEQRKKGIPLEYLLHRAPFMGNQFYCAPGALIPREETELLVEVAVGLIKEKQQSQQELIIIDIGTGCGNVAVSLVVKTHHTKVIACDISPQAIEIARENIKRFNVQDRVHLLCGNMFAPIEGGRYEGKIDIVISAPPYIPTVSLEKMDPEIIVHEPRLALDAGPYGLSFFRRLIAESPPMLKPEGVLIFEIGTGQEKLIKRLLQKSNLYKNVGCHDDGKKVRVISSVVQPQPHMV